MAQVTLESVSKIYPGTVKAVIDIDLPRPRDAFLLQTTPEFIDIYRHVWDLLRDDIRKSEAA